MCVDLPHPCSPTMSTRLLYSKPAKMQAVVDLSNWNPRTSRGTSGVRVEKEGAEVSRLRLKVSLKLTLVSGRDVRLTLRIRLVGMSGLGTTEDE